jgi:N-acetylmuramic acid 6-phosphate etherase
LLHANSWITPENDFRPTALTPVKGEPVMSTERPSPRYSQIDAWDASDALEAMIDGQFGAVAAVRAARSSIEAAAQAMEARLRFRGRMIYAGAGTSGRLAAQDGAELMPTFSWPRERLLLIMAGGPSAFIQAAEGAEDQVELAREAVNENKVDSKDVLIAVAASGTTPFTLACLRAAKQAGALTIGIANNRATPLLMESDYPIWLDTGSEPIAGSTRLIAGTAQKITLNLLSSLLMILLGRVYGGLMVDMQATNEKLLRRSEDMLMRLADCKREEARDALGRARGSVKIAVLLLRGCDPATARTLLNRGDGQLRRALALIGQRGMHAA